MLKHFTRLFCAVLLLLWFFPLSCLADEGEASQEQLRQSVVHLYGIGYDSAGKMQSRWSGTGFAVSPTEGDADVFLTNWHVVTGNGRFDAADVRLWVLKDNARFFPNREPMPESCISCKILASTTGYPDVAVIQTASPIPGCKALPLLSSRRVADGTEVYALGFPGLEATHYGRDSGPEDVVITSGQVSDHLIMSKAGYSKALIHTAAIRHGNSGGPLVNHQAEVVGLNTYGFQEDVTTEYFCAVYSDYGMKLLDELGIVYTEAAGASPITVLVADTLHLPQIGDAAAMCIFVLAVAAILLFIFYFLKTLREAVQELREKHRKKTLPE